ncbi:hypothetical protein, partial [Lactiplantibacillus pentosus]|uniref:hypothetical protein n=1 Tax=Lactiplantibacillus pentosus TaxID=1589 RepID=UPI0031ED7E8F
IFLAALMNVRALEMLDYWCFESSFVLPQNEKLVSMRFFMLWRMLEGRCIDASSTLFLLRSWCYIEHN